MFITHNTITKCWTVRLRFPFSVHPHRPDRIRTSQYKTRTLQQCTPHYIHSLSFASYLCSQHTFRFAISAFDGPVVVAVVVGGAFSVVQQTVAALFECQSAVRAQVELIAIIGVGVRLFAVLFRTLRRAVFLAPDHCETQNKIWLGYCT